MDYIKELKDIDACDDAMKWLEAGQYPTLQDAWNACERADWMLWLISRTVQPDADRKPIILCAVECARLALPIYEERYPNDDRVRKCLEATEKYALGEAPRDEVVAARKNAAAASIAAARAAYSAYSAYSAAESAESAEAAEAAEAAAYSAAESADATAFAAARAKMRADCAVIVRKYFPNAPELGNK